MFMCFFFSVNVIQPVFNKKDNKFKKSLCASTGTNFYWVIFLTELTSLTGTDILDSSFLGPIYIIDNPPNMFTDEKQVLIQLCPRQTINMKTFYFSPSDQLAFSLHRVQINSERNTTFAFQFFEDEV